MALPAPYARFSHINFETGIVTVETLAPDSQESYLKKAIITTLLTPDDPRQVDLYSDAIHKSDLDEDQRFLGQGRMEESETPTVYG